MDNDEILAKFDERLLQERLEHDRINEEMNREDTMSREQIDGTTQEPAVDTNIECNNNDGSQSPEQSNSNSKPFENCEGSPFKKHLEIAETVSINRKPTKSK